MARAAAANALWPKDRSFITSDGARLAYTVLGEGASGVPVVFMNGWTCPDAYWRRIVPAVVAAGHPVVLFDTRGHAQSSIPRRTGQSARGVPVEDVSVARVAADVVELIDETDVGAAVLVGHSMGVQGIFEAYRAGGSVRVAGLVPVAGTYENPVPTFASMPVLDRLFPVGDALLSRVPFKAMRPVMSQAHRMPKGVTMKLIGGILRTNDTVAYDDVEPHVRQIGDVDFGIMWRMMSQMRAHSAADVLPTIDVPVLILAGERDHFTPLAVQERMHDLIAGSDLVVYPAGGHLLPVEEAGALASDLVSWLSRRFR